MYWCFKKSSHLLEVKTNRQPPYGHILRVTSSRNLPAHLCSAVHLCFTLSMTIPPPTPIQLDNEIDGEEIGSRNYRFSQIGEPVPIYSNTSSQFDPKWLPSQPLAVSERFRLLFVAHPHGFCVARTTDVMVSAEQIKDKQKGQSVQELCLLDVSFGNVTILCLSADDSMLAATVGGHVHFFSVNALLNKERRPSFAVSLDDSSSIKEMRWSRTVAKVYVILSAHGKLSYGSGDTPLSHVMDNVDSVDWSVEGNFVAVAKQNIICILSSELKEMLSFSLQFRSVVDDCDSDINRVIKVDSVRWIRPDCIVVGCFVLNDDGMEENYIVHVITSKEGRITDAASKWIVLSFNNIFVDFCSDAVPTRNGPHLFLSYLDLHGLAFIATRNLSRHVGLLCWSLDNGKNEATMVEILNDAWTLYINSQGNGEENVTLGLSVDKVSQNKNVKLTLGDADTEVSPFCVIICLTIDGKISVFHFASAAGALLFPEGAASDEADNDSQVSFKHDSPKIPFRGGDGSGVQTFSKSESQILSRIEKEETNAEATVTKNVRDNSMVYSQTLELDESTRPLSVMSNQDSVKDNQSTSKGKFITSSLSQTVAGDFSNQPVTWSNGRVDASMTYVGKPFSLTFDEVDGSNKFTLHASGSLFQNSSDFSEKDKTSTKLTAFEKKGSTGLGNMKPAYPVSQKALEVEKSMKSEFHKDSFAASTLTGLPNSGQNPSKHFGNVEEMAKKLNTLLEGIEGKGGFTDASITSQEISVVEFEDSMWSLSNRCQMRRGLMDAQLRDVHLLLDKTVQVLARKVYLEGIFKQDADSRYWQLWNCQKLSSELELKRRHVLDLKQELTNQLIELERHFNSLEFNKFGVNGALQSWRASRRLHGISRKIQSLNSLHYTMNAQLAAAEQLSECLSKQMAVLSIESCGKKHDVREKLFESIGLSYAGDSHLSPVRNRNNDTLSHKEQFTGSTFHAVKEQPKRNQGSFHRYEPETARRSRDSLDQSWTSFEPPKTTLKRILLKEDYEKGSADRSRLKIDEHYLNPQSQNKLEVSHSKLLDTSAASLNLSKSKAYAGISGILARQFNERSSISSFQRKSDLFDCEILGSSMKKDSVLLPPFIPKSMTMTCNNELGTSKLKDEKLKKSVPSSEKNDSLAESKCNVIQKSNSSFHLGQSVSTGLPEQSRTSPSDSMGSLNRFKIESTKSASGDFKNEQTLADNAFNVSKFLAIPTSHFSSALNESDRDSSAESSYEPNQPCDDWSVSTSLQSVFGTLPSRNVLTPLSSTLSLSSPESNLSSTSLSSRFVKSEPLKSSTSSPVAMHGSKKDASVISTLSTTEKDAKIQASPSQPVLQTSMADLKIGSSEPSILTRSPTDIKSTSEMDISVSSIRSSVITSTGNLDKPYPVEASGGIVGSVKNLISDPSQEEEMEEEASEIDQMSELALGNLGGFGIGSMPGNHNPFGAASLNKELTPVTSPFTMPATTPSGELFRPASFSFQSPKPPEPVPVQPTAVIAFSSGFSAGSLGQISSVSGFGQPAHIGSGQQALGSVLGTFGQSRQLGAGPTGSSITGNGIAGGFLGNAVCNFGGGFASASTYGGFASLAAGGGGFTSGTMAGGQFAAAASAGVRFPSPASTGASFSGGGFGAFSNQQGSGLSAFGGDSGTARPPSEFFTQMRK